ncbi:MAG TPA: glycosyltransferase family 1 protein [Anaerolineales bacterium]|nr:glycosyltransferase family 1 protein [Anaerolineales bacterium]
MTRDIVVNGRFLTRRITGVERYGHEILRWLGNHCRLERPARALNGIQGHAWEQFILPRKLNPESILWSPANTGPLFVPNQALTIQDLSPLEHPEWFRATFASWYRLFLPILARHAKVIFVPSEYVRKKIMARFGISHVIAIPSGVNRETFHPAARQSTYDLPERYILFVGSLEPRKNLSGLLDDWNGIKREFPDVTLVIAGATGRVFRKVELPRSHSQVLFLGHVETELPALYANAELFVLPSFDEGFGLPVVEAMACGAPVIVSDRGALPEVLCDAGLTVNLSNSDNLSAAMRQCLSDKDLRLSMKEKGLVRAKDFSWQRTAESVWKILNEI